MKATIGAALALVVMARGVDAQEVAAAIGSVVYV